MLQILATRKNREAIVESYCGSPRPPRPLRRTPLRVLRHRVNQVRGYLVDQGAENLQFSIAGRTRLECALAEAFCATPRAIERGRIITRGGRMVLHFGAR